MKKLLILCLLATATWAQTVVVGAGAGITITTVSGLAGVPNKAKGTIAVVTDGNSATDCTVGGASTVVNCQYSGSTWAQVPASGAGGTSFSSITGNTNTTAAMVVGTGASLGTSGSGTISASSAAKWTSARNLAGNSVDGSANVPFANAFVVEGTADAGLTGAQFLGALSTGPLKVTTTTGALTTAAAADIYALWSGSCDNTKFLRGDGACVVPAWSALGNPAGALSLSMAANTSTFTWGNATGAGTNMFTVRDTSSNTGTGAVLAINTATSSAAKPLQVTAAGTANGIDMSTSGVLEPIGAGVINANQLNGAAVPTSQAYLASNGNNQLVAATAPVTSVTGTSNQITVTGTTTPTLSIPSTFIAPGSIQATTTLGAGTAPTVCGSATGCYGATEGGTGTSPTANQDAIRADTGHVFKVTLNGGTEFTSAMNLNAANVCAPGAFASQTDGSTVTWAIGSAMCANASLTFTTHGGNRTLNITNPVNGGSYVIWLKQDGTGGEGLILGTGCTWKVAGSGAGAITLSTGANAIDVLAFLYDGANCLAVLNKTFS